MAPKIEAYRFGHIVIDGETHTNDVIILPERVIGGWWREEGHVLHIADLDAVFDAAPDALIVGQGANGRMRVPREVERALSDAGIELIAANTHDAVERYNAMRDQRDIAAALHLTC
jgi:hypothetical protein